jgi:hypothetical protein
MNTLQAMIFKLKNSFDLAQSQEVVLGHQKTKPSATVPSLEITKAERFDTP